MWNIKFVFVVLCVVSQTAKLNAYCFGDSVEDCKTRTGFDIKEVGMQQISRKELPTETWLNEYCGPLLLYGQCMYDKLEGCRDLGSKLLVSYINNISKEICNTDSNMRRIYTENVACMNENIGDMEQCLRKAVEVYLSEYENYLEVSENERHGITCLYSHIAKDVCIGGILESNCGAEAGNFTKGMFDEVPLQGNDDCSPEIIAQALETRGETVRNWRWRDNEL